VRRPDAQSAAGGVSSTVRDMARWMVMLLDEGRFEGRQRQDWESIWTKRLAPIMQPHGELAGKTRPTFPRPPRPLGAYVGSYANRFYGPAQVGLQSGGAGLQVSLGQQRIVLSHWDGEVFSFVPEGDSPGSLSQATFDGNQLTLEYFDDVLTPAGVSAGIGRFSR
jgi:CubicO group peptidase (beta-lactamase class C family)